MSWISNKKKKMSWISNKKKKMSWISNKKKKMGLFLKYYAIIQLYIFIGVILANSFAVLLFPSVFVKEAVIMSDLERNKAIMSDLEMSELINDVGYEKITKEELEELEKKQGLYNIIGAAGIIGWCLFNPDFKKGIKNIYKVLKNEVQKREKG